MRSALQKAAQMQRIWFVSRQTSTSRGLPGGVFEAEVVDRRPAMIVLRVTGKGAAAAFANEAGGHRWQRIPPTERSGRVHTSTVTVSVLPEPEPRQIRIEEKDLEWRCTRGTGPGGQHRNVTASAVYVRHVPSGIDARCESERSQHRNKASALAVLLSRIAQKELATFKSGRDSDRKKQVGSGMRGDKRRTIRVRDGIVTDHILGKRWNLREYTKGEWD